MDNQSTTICIAGEAGQGLDTLGQMLSKALVRSGYEILVSQNYMSRIRGGHNFYTIRAGMSEIMAPAERIDILVAFNEESIDKHKDELVQNSLVICEAGLDKEVLVSQISVPFKELVQERILDNTVALGCLSAVLNLDKSIVSNLVKETLGKSHADLVEKNKQALDKGIEWTQQQAIEISFLPSSRASQDKLMLNASQGIALGAIVGGVNFCSFYPMTPATGVALNLVAHASQAGIIVEQAEDELAAINMAIGASFAGAKSLVPTSGGGFALMSEGISLSGMTETPVVIVLAQRPAPATGLPTRTEQADLELALFSGHGEFPRAVFSPGTPEECFYLTYKAIELAERYQSPVIILSDQYLADSYRAVDPFDLDWLPGISQPETSVSETESYQRYEFTANGVSPRLIPGFDKHLVVADSDEHSFDGHITEDQTVREKMVEKRLAKNQGLMKSIVPPEVFGDQEADLLLLSWGSSTGAIHEAAIHLREQGQKVKTIHLSQVWPLDKDDFLPHLRAAGQVVAVEGNATGQLAKLIKQETGFDIPRIIHRYDGLPFTADF